MGLPTDELNSLIMTEEKDTKDSRLASQILYYKQVEATVPSEN